MLPQPWGRSAQSCIECRLEWSAIATEDQHGDDDVHDESDGQHRCRSCLGRQSVSVLLHFRSMLRASGVEKRSAGREWDWASFRLFSSHLLFWCQVRYSVFPSRMAFTGTHRYSRVFSFAVVQVLFSCLRMLRNEGATCGSEERLWFAEGTNRFCLCFPPLLISCLILDFFSKNQTLWGIEYRN